MTDLLTPDEAARELGVTRVTIFRMLQDGRLRRFKKGVGRSTYVAREDLAKLTEARIVPAKRVARKRKRAR